MENGQMRQYAKKISAYAVNSLLAYGLYYAGIAPGVGSLVENQLRVCTQIFTLEKDYPGFRTNVGYRGLGSDFDATCKDHLKYQQAMTTGTELDRAVVIFEFVDDSLRGITPNDIRNRACGSSRASAINICLDRAMSKSQQQ